MIATEGEAKRSVDLNIPVGVDDGDKITVERQGHRSEFRGNTGSMIKMLVQYQCIGICAAESPLKLKLFHFKVVPLQSS